MIDSEHLDKRCINTIRTLSINAVEMAGSGHPGIPMDAASTVYCLWHSGGWSGDSTVVLCVTAQILVAAISIFRRW